MTGTQTVIVVGAGGHARVLLDTLARSGVAVGGLTDADSRKADAIVYGLPVLGDDRVLERFPPEST